MRFGTGLALALCAAAVACADGNILLLAGFAVAGATLWALPLTLFFLWFYYPPAIEYEDRKLRGIFGTQWEAWAGKVPALVPRLGGARAGAGRSWSLAKNMRTNGEIFIVLYVLAGMWIVVARVA